MSPRVRWSPFHLEMIYEAESGDFQGALVDSSEKLGQGYIL